MLTFHEFVSEDAQTTFQQKVEYKGPRQKVPFPLHNWRNPEHPSTIPGVDRKELQRKGKTVNVALKDLHATQPDVRQIDVNHKTTETDHPVVVKKGEKLWIQDGHHRPTCKARRTTRSR
jgi:hypothetical protein